MNHPGLIILLLMFAMPVVNLDFATGEEQRMHYPVHRLQPATGQQKEFCPDADWDSDVWKDVQPLQLTHFMGERPAHFPPTQAKLLYDEDAIYVIFRVEDRYVRAVAEEHQDHVFLDSCVEFFFTPADNVETAYFNLEMNCGGTMLLHYQTIPRVEAVELTEQEIAQIQVASTLPKIVEPEIADPKVWAVEYRLPISVLKKYYPSLVQPASGVTWRANLYKCADKTSHPHWLTWAKVENPSPNFHIPKFFGQLVFQ